MKKIISILLIAILSLSTMSGCANDRNITIQTKDKIERVHAEPYGLCDKDEVKIEGVKYSVSVGNVVLGVIFCETIIVPILVFGWYLYEPDCAENNKIN